MSPSRTFILRPIATSLFMVGILLTGIIAYRQLPVSALPEVDYPIIQVVTFYPGASPDVDGVFVRHRAAGTPVRSGARSAADDLHQSLDGSSVITLQQFNLQSQHRCRSQEVRQSINASGTFLPADLPTPPVYRKTNPADAPILTLALTSKAIPLSEVEDLADTRLAPKISQLPGVGLVEHQRRRSETRGPHSGKTRYSWHLTASISKIFARRSQRRTSIRPKEISMACTSPTRSEPAINC